MKVERNTAPRAIAQRAQDILGAWDRQDWTILYGDQNSLAVLADAEAQERNDLLQAVVMVMREAIEFPGACSRADLSASLQLLKHLAHGNAMRPLAVPATTSR